MQGGVNPLPSSSLSGLYSVYWNYMHSGYRLCAIIALWVDAVGHVSVSMCTLLFPCTLLVFCCCRFILNGRLLSLISYMGQGHRCTYMMVVGGEQVNSNCESYRKVHVLWFSVWGGGACMRLCVH